jgi:hypothetical protein
MKIKLWILGIVLILANRAALAQEWKPAKGPLATRWAKDVSPDRVLPEYPRPQMVRKEWKNLNGVWQLALGQEGDAPPTGKDLAERILVPFPVESALSGVMKHADRLWYRRNFQVPKEWSGKRTLLHFGAVDWQATVWVNGKKLGTHQGGYDGFHYDITDALRVEGDQELIVGVWDPTDKGPQPRGKQVLKPGGIYYTPVTGIWQTVWLEPVNKVYIESLKIIPDVDRGEIRIRATVAGAGANEQIDVVPVDKSLFDGKYGKPGEELRIPLKKIKPWSSEDPFLYKVIVESSGGPEPDVVESYFAMRKISLGKDEKGITRMMLNGKPVFQLGPLDQGFWPDGIYTAPTDEALRYDIEMTKKLGFNMCRKHVKVEPERWYYWCDKLGLLVWQDMPSGDKGVAPGKGEITRTARSAEIYNRELKRMIDGLYNHPSIVMWVVFNEGWGQFDTRRVTAWTRQYDPSRLVDCASGWNDMNVGDVHDIHVYPGPGSPPPENHRAAVLGEFGGLGLGVDGHTWAKQTWGYRGTKSQDDLTRRYERLLQRVFELKEKPGLSAAIYTQTTDVETEGNGLLTYDREVVKMDAERLRAANGGDFSRIPSVRAVVPTSQAEGQVWRYTLDKPAKDWLKPDFDASTWKEGRGGFGARGTPGATVRTEWNTNDIWLRRTFTLPEGPAGDLHLTVHHDEDAEIYLNGVLATKLAGYITDYEEALIAPGALAALKPGRNTLAVHCKQTTGGQYIDVGIIRVETRNHGNK